MKTAMQEFIEYLEGIKKRDNIPSWVITTAKNYLEPEKQQILNACVEFGMHNDKTNREKGEDYYNETYKPKP